MMHLLSSDFHHDNETGKVQKFVFLPAAEGMRAKILFLLKEETKKGMGEGSAK